MRTSLLLLCSSALSTETINNQSGGDINNQSGGANKPVDREALEFLFANYVDLDGDGKFNADDILKATITLRNIEALDVAKKQAPRFNKTKGENITFGDFFDVYGIKSNSSEADKVNKAMPNVFAALDLDKNEELNVQELAGLFGHPNEELRKITTDVELEHRDKDGDGKIYLHEFLTAEFGDDFEEKVSKDNIDSQTKDFHAYDEGEKGYLVRADIYKYTIRSKELQSVSHRIVTQLHVDKDGFVMLNQIVDDTVSKTLIRYDNISTPPVNVTNFLFLSTHPLMQEWIQNSGVNKVNYLGFDELMKNFESYKTPNADVEVKDEDL